MTRVLITAPALEDLAEMSPTLRKRMEGLFTRLGDWPDVSGAKPLRWALAGRWRLRTGDYRVQFRIDGTDVIVEKVGHRDRFYEA
jgi:mRNA-degrading endonuclease RelE of RelBE toxin-antitoxin system